MFSLRPTWLTRVRTSRRRRDARAHRILASSPSFQLRNCPWIRPHHVRNARGVQQMPRRCAAVAEFSVRFPPQERNARKERAALGSGGPRVLLVLLFPSFFPAALACQCFFHTLLLAGFQIKGVALYLLDNVFLLHLTLEAAQCVLEGLALLQSDFCQRNYTPRLVLFGPDSYCKVLRTSQDLYVTLGQIAADLC